MFDAADFIQLIRLGSGEASIGRYTRSRAMQNHLAARLVEELRCCGEWVRSAATTAAARAGFLSHLLADQLRTALDIDFDLLVNLEGVPARDWAERTGRRLGLPPEWVFRPAPVRLFPGIALSCEMLARRLEWMDLNSWWTEAEADLVDLLGPLATDPLSRDPRTDIPGRPARIGIPLTSVGATSSEVPVRLGDGHSAADHRVEIAITCSLAADQRGVHMSRFQQTLVEAAGRDWPDLPSFALALAREARTRQGAESARVSAVTHRFFAAPAPATGTPSLQPAVYRAAAETGASGEWAAVGLRLNVMTACPCTLAFSRLSLGRKLGKISGLPEETGAALPPTFTHSQPGTVEATVRSARDLPGLNALYDAIDSAAHLIHAVLKRPDEHELVLRSHQQPQFCEDLARSVAVAVASLCSAGDMIEVTVELDESIHPHKAYASLEMLAERLWQSPVPARSYSAATSSAAKRLTVRRSKTVVE